MVDAMAMTTTAIAVKERPILFSGPMVRAILEGRKTQTRRVITPQPNNPETFGISPVWGSGVRCFDGRKPIAEEDRKFEVHAAFNENGKRVDRWLACPYGKPVDRLWVRETWCMNEPPSGAVYRADAFAKNLQPWRPSIFMPRWASRITLEIVKVRVERVQDISDSDAMAEGVQPNHYYCEQPVKADDDGIHRCNAVAAYQLLWESINAKRGFGWDTNPWVWVIEFKRV